MRPNYLFSKQDLHGLLRQVEAKIIEEVNTINAETLLNTSTDSLADVFVEKYSMVAPTLFPDRKEMESREVMIDAGRGWRGDNIQRSGIEVKVFVPFEGDRELFYWQPSSSRSVVPHADVRENELEFSSERDDHDAEKIKREIDRQLDGIEWYLNAVRGDVQGFNQSLRNKCRSKIEERKEKLLKDRNMVSSLGIPLRRRGGETPTFPAPSVKRKIRPQLPQSTLAPFKPEPVLLNGKTDILIREGEKNIFIAECKFWSGPKGFTETIDQLLGYLAWRDTKAAIILFNSNRDFSAVLAKIPGTVTQHANYARTGEPSISETEFRYVFRHRDDTSRELLGTVEHRVLCKSLECCILGG